jgi:ribonuclease HI
VTTVGAAGFVVEADGGSRGNPGPAGFGAVVKDSGGRVLAESAESIGIATNNVAEYRGLIAGLRALVALGAEGRPVEVRMDSKLVVEQMAGRWKVKHEGLRPLALEAAALARNFRVTWTWIPRERNTYADRLANEAMDAAARGETWRSSVISPKPDQETEPDEPAAIVEPQAEPPGVAAGRESHGWMPRPSRVATSLLLLRHGQTPLSVDKRFSGTGDPALTETGLAQAEAAALRLSRPPYEVGAIVTSPLARARRTAEAVAARTSGPGRGTRSPRSSSGGLRSWPPGWPTRRSPRPAGRASPRRAAGSPWHGTGSSRRMRAPRSWWSPT